MGESSDTPLKLQFDRRVRLDFRGAAGFAPKVGFPADF